MDFTQRYSSIINGSIAFIGNSLTLTKLTKKFQAGTLGSAGAFTSLDTSLKVNDFPYGTTTDYLLNGSSAELTLPNNSTVVYAELIWGGLSESMKTDVRNKVNSPVKLVTPTGTYTVTPNVITNKDFPMMPATGYFTELYTRSANVTKYVKSSGSYATKQVISIIEEDETDAVSLSHAGWTLAVVYKNKSLPKKSINLWTGGNFASSNFPSVDVTLGDFYSPNHVGYNAKLYVSAQEGDCATTGDQLLFGKDTDSLTPLSGSNNPANNFFASQINDSNGQLVTTGTFGDRNADTQTNTNTVACRHGWDITAVDVSHLMEQQQEQASARLIADGETYLVNAFALELEGTVGKLKATKTANLTSAVVGENIDYTITIVNDGPLDTANLRVTDDLPAELTLVENSITVNGEPYEGDFPVTINTLDINSTATVTFSATVNSKPNNNEIINNAEVQFSYNPFPPVGVVDFAYTHSDPTLIYLLDVSHTKGVDKAYTLSQDVLTYSATITNNGEVNATVNFVDTMPAGVQFLAGSVIIDGVSKPELNPEHSFCLGQLTPGQSVNISFKATVD